MGGGETNPIRKQIDTLRRLGILKRFMIPYRIIQADT